MWGKDWLVRKYTTMRQTGKKNNCKRKNVKAFELAPGLSILDSIVNLMKTLEYKFF